MSLEEIRERVENAPRLLVATTEENDFYPASVYEEEDGLNTLCYLPGEYSGEWQDTVARAIVDAYEDRARLLAALDAVCTSLPSICESLAEDEMEDGARSIVDEAIKNWKPRDY